MQRPPFRHHYAATTPLLAVVLALPYSAFSYAADEDMWRLCTPQQLVPSLSTGKLAADATRVSAERASRNKDKVLLLEGDALIERGKQSVQSEHAEYTEQDEFLKVKGNVRYRNETLQLRSESAEVHMAKQSGHFEQVDYLYPKLHASGKAKRLIQENETHSRMEQVSFSTCDPNKRDWHLKADRIELNQETHQGMAYYPSLYIKDVPVLPLPFPVRFPIGDQRMSGLLFPDLAYDPVTGALDLAVPYYWNIAPNYDATIIPHLLSARGIMLHNQWRYLARHSKGTLEFEYLPDDRLTGSDRGLLAYQHETRYASGWSHSAQLNYVSEQAYYNDLGSKLELSREPYLKNQLDSRYNGKRWNFSGTVQAFQTLTSTEQYQRMPQLSLSLKPAGNNRLNTIFNSEYNYFYADTKPYIGSRLTTQLGLSYPYTTTAGFITPRLSWHSSQYQIEDTLDSTSSQPTRELPIFSLDSGLFFERRLASNSLIQTLEPRLYYLHVPYVDQSAIPIFDSGNYTFNFNQLFRENRFTGSDRIADANQLSVALSSRFISTQTGSELFSVSLGQIFYLQDRQVQLLDTTLPSTSSDSDYIAALRARIAQHWSWKSDLLWQPNTSMAKSFNSRLQYKSDKAHIANLNYNSQSDGSTRTLAQMDLSTLWKLNPRWHLYGRYNYDLQNETELEQLFGLGYESCCWAFRIVQRNYRTHSTEPVEQTLGFEFEFKGLGSAGGNHINEYLKTGIIGFESKPR